MTVEQAITLAVLASVIGALVWDKVRSDIVALAGAAVLLLSGAVRPSEVQGAFGSPALITLAALFVIAHSMELSGLLGWLIRRAVALCKRIGVIGLWLLLGLCGGASAFLNNTPIVVLAAPVVRDVAKSLGQNPKRFLIPLSYIAILGGACTLIGTSTNLLVDDMARSAGQRPFGLFEITPVGLIVGAAGAAYLMLFSGRLLERATDNAAPSRAVSLDHKVSHFDVAGRPVALEEEPEERPVQVIKALVSVAIFLAVVTVAALNLAPIAATAFAGAVALILLRIITAEEAYSGLKPEILFLVAGMVVLGIALERTGLAAAVTNSMLGTMNAVGPLVALIVIYAATLLLTEILSNAAVAVLITPIAVALAESLGVSPRPFLVAVMMAGSAAFATPFGYQTNVLVYQMGQYSYMDFVRIGLPLNLITLVVGVSAILWFFPF